MSVAPVLPVAVLTTFWLRHRTPYEPSHKQGDVVEVRMEIGGAVQFHKYKLHGFERSYESGRSWLIEEWRIENGSV